MNVFARALAVATFLTLGFACSDERPDTPTSNDGGSGTEGGESTHFSGRGGSVSSEGGVGAAANDGGGLGGDSSVAGGAGPLGGGGADSPNGQAGAGGAIADGRLEQVDDWLAGKRAFSSDFRAALRAVAVKNEHLLASTDDTALEAARAFLLARQCAYYARLGAPPWQLADVLVVREALGELRAIQLDTWQRGEKYVHANQAASGYTFPLIAGVELAATCEQLLTEAAR